jgi:DsbC/DsbD-like thiol-disulfide interchange protein
MGPVTGRNALFSALICFLLPGVVCAAAIPHGNVELVADSQSIHPGGSFEAGLHFTLEKGWHIYWINPGDAGEPPRVKWNLPLGLSAGDIRWPVPQPLPAYTTMDFGYEGEVLLAVPMKVAAGLKPGTAELKADLKLIVCREVCIPGKAQLSLNLPVERRALSPNPASQALFASTQRRLAQPAPPFWHLAVSDDGDRFHLVAKTGTPVKQAFFFPLDANQIENAAPQTLNPSNHGFELTLKKSNQLVGAIPSLKGVLGMGEKGYIINVPVKPVRRTPHETHGTR